MNKQTNEHAFSIELTSKRYVSFKQSKDVESEVLIEGTLGNLVSLTFVEGMMLELRGTNGVFRLDMTESEWNHLYKKEVDA